MQEINFGFAMVFLNAPFVIYVYIAGMQQMKKMRMMIATNLNNQLDYEISLVQVKFRGQ